MRTTFDRRDGDCGTTILIVDDDETIRCNLQTICGELDTVRPINILTVADLAGALDRLAETCVDVVLLDKNLKRPDGVEDNGIDAIPELLQVRPHLQILIISGSRETQDIVKAMRLGAFGFVTKGVDDELLPSQIRKAIEVSQITLQKSRYEKSVVRQEPMDLVGTSFAVSRLRALVPQLAQTDGPVLLLGETGTGKTTLAKLIHKQRKHFLKQEHRPFFYVNIAALSPTLVERELFGSEPGSYTGAPRSIHQGFFELANTGTLFLDEIADISPEVQSKLLEVLQEGTFYRVGGTKKISTSFKLICATNQNLYELSKEKLFREDLYWRIASLPIELPPLRGRQEDITEIIRAVLPSVARKSHASLAFDDLPADFVEHLTNNPPEGNIRGIEQKLIQLLTLCPKDKRGSRLLNYWRRVPELLPCPLPKRRARTGLAIGDLLSAPIDTSSPDFPGFHKFVESVERRILLDAKERFRSTREIAKALGLAKSAVSQRLKLLNGTVAPAVPGDQIPEVLQ